MEWLRAGPALSAAVVLATTPRLQSSAPLDCSTAMTSWKEELRSSRSVLHSYLDRVEKSLDDMRLQAEMYSLLEGLLPQFQMTRSRAVQVEYRQSQALLSGSRFLPDRAELFEQVRAALRHYWGGSGITQSNLINLRIVQDRMSKDQETAVNALRNILQDCVCSAQTGRRAQNG